MIILVYVLFEYPEKSQFSCVMSCVHNVLNKLLFIPDSYAVIKTARSNLQPMQQALLSWQFWHLMDCYSEDENTAVIIHPAKCDTSVHQGITQGTSTTVDKRLDITQGRTHQHQLLELKQPLIKT